MKKKISLYMAVIMLFNLFVPFTMPATVAVHAAAPNLILDTNRGAAPGIGGTPTPMTQNVLATQEQFHMMFETGTSGNFTLHHSLPDREIALDIIVGTVTEPDDDGIPVSAFVASVSYRVAERGDIPIATTPGAINTGQVFGTQTENFVSIPEFIATWWPNTDMGHRVRQGMVGPNPANPALITPDITAERTWFDMRPGAGFSLRHEGHEIHILFEQTGNQILFHYTSNMFSRGYIYEAVLQRHVSPGFAAGIGDPVLFNTGIEADVTRTFANAEGSVAYGRAYDRTIANNEYINRDPWHPADPLLHHSNPLVLADDNADGRRPAQPDEPLGFTLEFPEPAFRALRFTHPAGTYPDLPVRPADVIIPVVISLGGSQNPVNFSVRIDNIYAPNLEPSLEVPADILRPFDTAGQRIRRNPVTEAIEMDFLVRDPANIGYYLPNLLFPG